MKTPRLHFAPPRIRTPDTRRVKPAGTGINKRTESIYGSAQWKAVRAQLLAERGSICQQCGRHGRVILDHVHELRDGGAPFDPANLIFLCDEHHGAKTLRERARRMAERF